MDHTSSNTWIPAFDKAFQSATALKANRNEDGTMNWNFVESDIHIDLSKTDFTIPLDALNEEFDFSCEEFISNANAMNKTV